jgi:hypothetical protein
MSVTDRKFPQFYGQGQWTELLNRNFEATALGEGRYEPIRRHAFGTDGGRVLLVGCRSSVAKPTWNLGVWTWVATFATPNTNSDILPYTVLVREPCMLNVFTLVKIPKYFLDNTTPYSIFLVFPFWLTQVNVEVYRYNGADTTLFD